MYSLIFGLFSVALILFYGMVHTFIYVKKMKRELKEKQTYLNYGVMLGLFGTISLILAIILYNVGIG